NIDFTKKFFSVTKNVQNPNTQATTTNEQDIKDISDGSREFIDDDINISLTKSKKLQDIIDNGIRKKRELDNNLSVNRLSNEKLSSQIAKKKFNRNDKVDVRYKDGRILRGVKFKKVEQDLTAGVAEIVK
ncbi:hypothetical protein D6810_00270, partial [Candidatus Dojkabacteria bacterium]